MVPGLCHFELPKIGKHSKSAAARLGETTGGYRSGKELKLTETVKNTYKDITQQKENGRSCHPG